jgi:hypothetical protein
MKKLIVLLLAGLCLALSGCASSYYDYSGSPVLHGQGGASKNVGGIDIWVIGTPPRNYRIIGYVEDHRPAGPLTMAARNPQLAALCRQRGGDALLLSGEENEFMGSAGFATANATGWGNATTFGNQTTFNGGATAFGNGMSVALKRRNSRYYVIKYVN